ncbi:MAG: 30S ribosomal protein S12 methylthiotransferase RimO [Atopobiaceae bacterium]|nr:30S ribosomal protein S12 methylthiotransferase RimO [Atopobiaceae bacterium]
MVSPSNTPTIDKKNILFVTLGCAKNEVDTDRMRALLFAQGFSEVNTPDEADIVLINTCSFLASATEESIETTLQIAEGTSHGVRSLPIVMCGCVPSRYGSKLPDQLPEVAAFVRADEEDGIVDVVSEVLGIERTPQSVIAAHGMLRTVEGASAYVKISDGCDRFCAFCAIPYIRGHYQSRPADEILSEVSSLMEGGVREIILIGQDTGIWGNDIAETNTGEVPTLAWLMRQVAQVVRPYNGWVRVLYLQPEGMTDELISTIRDTPECLPYIDIPIQHCSERVLVRMGRSGSAPELRSLFDRLRREIPGMVLRTTGMCGFPGETEEESDELYDFIQEQEFDYTSVFTYSPEEGTAGASMPNQVPDEIKMERTQRLIDLVEELGFAGTAGHVGERCEVIIDGIEHTDEGFELIGHAWFQAPDCDGAVHIANGEARVGDIVLCDLVDSFCYEIIGEIVGEKNR